MLKSLQSWLRDNGYGGPIWPPQQALQNPLGVKLTSWDVFPKSTVLAPIALISNALFGLRPPALIKDVVPNSPVRPLWDIPEKLWGPVDYITRTPETSFWSQHMRCLALSWAAVCVLFLEKKMVRSPYIIVAFAVLTWGSRANLATTTLHFGDSTHSWFHFIFPAPCFPLGPFPSSVEVLTYSMYSY